MSAPDRIVLHDAPGVVPWWQDADCSDAPANALSLDGPTLTAVIEALRPFARAGELFSEEPRDYEQSIYAPAAGPEYSIGENDLRKARAALKLLEGK